MKNNLERFYDEEFSQRYKPNGRFFYYCDDRHANVEAFVLEEGTGKKVLDVGCGNGWQASLYQKGNDVWGIDFSQTNLEKAGQFGIRTVLHDVECPFPFEDRVFDIVVCSETLEHVFLPEMVLWEINRVLKDDGLLVITVPNLLCLRNRLEIALGKESRFVEYPNEPGHIRFYSRKGIVSLLQLAGFKVMKWKGQSFSLNFTLMKRILYFLHGGNRGLRLFLRIISFGRIKEEIPAYIFRFHLERFFGRLLPDLAPGLILKAQKISPPKEGLKTIKTTKNIR